MHDKSYSSSTMFFRDETRYLVRNHILIIVVLYHSQYEVFGSM